MSWLLRFYNSNIGLKIVMAITGVVMFGFVLGHMIGNLQVFWGEEILDGYAASLHDHPTLLWPIRGVLLGSLLAHVHAAVTLTLRSKAARPVGYRKHKRTSRSELFMRITGVAVLAFIVFHLMHLTLGMFHSSFVHGEVYNNVVAAFSNPLIAIVYIAANLMLGPHLYHGLWSLLRTLGMSNPRYDQLARGFATVFALTIVAGNVLMPLSIMAGLIS